MSILRMPPLTPSLPQTRNLSSIGASTSTTSLLLLPPNLRTITPFRPTTTIIRMGGGPRTFPGGVSKWQWKRMQAKKQKQLLKARLCRERQIYEMRKRAELRAAVSELERPWEVVERAPTLLSVSTDEQLKTLADRFYKPGGFDLWSDSDGPRLLLGGGEGDEGIPSARFLPQDSVYSVKPYGVRGDGDLSTNGRNTGLRKKDRGKRHHPKELSHQKEFNHPQSSRGVNNEEFRNTKNKDAMDGLKHLRISNGGVESDRKGSLRGRLGKKGTKQNVKLGNSNVFDSKQVSSDTENNRVCYLGQRRRSGSSQPKSKVSPRREVHDMSLKHDGSYQLQIDHQHRNVLFGGELEDDFELDITNWRKSGN